MMRCLIIDDEELVRDLLEDNIRQVPFLQMVGKCKNAMEAYDLLEGGVIDLMFLDIRMPKLTGLQFLQSLSRPPLAILVTAYEQYALKGFDYQVVDYLLKPFSFERFLKACNRANDLFRLQQREVAAAMTPSAVSPAPTPPEKELDYFFVNVEYTLVKVTVSEIEYIEALKDYIRIHLSSSRPVLTRMSLKEMEDILPSRDFIRTHKSFLVAIPKITVLKRDIICIGNTEIPIGDSYRQQVSRAVNLPKR
jgi:DNA-binding LytR/AlgR family response regulator